MVNSITVRITRDALVVEEGPLPAGPSTRIARTSVRQLGVVEYECRLDGLATSRFALVAELDDRTRRGLVIHFVDGEGLRDVERAVESAWQIADVPVWFDDAASGLPRRVVTLRDILGAKETDALVGTYAVRVTRRAPGGDPYRAAREPNAIESTGFPDLERVTVRALPYPSRVLYIVAKYIVGAVFVLAGLVYLAYGWQGLHVAWVPLACLAGWLFLGPLVPWVVGYAKYHSRPVMFEVAATGIVTPSRTIDRDEISGIRCVVVPGQGQGPGRGQVHDTRPIVVKTKTGDKVDLDVDLVSVDADELEWLLIRVEGLLGKSVTRTS